MLGLFSAYVANFCTPGVLIIILILYLCLVLSAALWPSTVAYCQMAFALLCEEGFYFVLRKKKEKKKKLLSVSHVVWNWYFVWKIRSEKCWRVKVVKLELVLRYIQLQQMMRVSSYFYISGPFVPPFCCTCTSSDHGVNILPICDNKFIYSYLNC